MVFSFAEKYLPISPNDLDDSRSSRESSRSFSQETTWGRRILEPFRKASFWSLVRQWTPWLLSLCLLISNIHLWIQIKSLVFNDAVYSPVDIASYGWKNVNFAAATQDELTEYQGVPNAENNKLWNDAFNIFGISKITLEEARPLKNRTVPIDDEGHYIVTLDVFHQLHCLNKMRQKIYWNTTNYGEPEPPYINMIHIDHCIDQMRQSLMCTVDVTPIPYEWYPKYGAYMPSTGIMHTCRNFEAVQEWAKKRPAGIWDTKNHRADPLGDQVHTYKEWWCKENGGCEWTPGSDFMMEWHHVHGSDGHEE